MIIEEERHHHKQI